MADDDFLLRPERWHDRALETIAMARDAKDGQDRKRLLKVARAYSFSGASTRLERGRGEAKAAGRGERCRPLKQRTAS
jgi:hypothetical protein